LFNSFHLTDPFHGASLQSRWWIMDREREAFFVGLGGQGHYSSDIPNFYALVWQSKIIRIETFSNVTGDQNNGYEASRRITSIKAPESLLIDNEKILELIKDALIANSTDVNKNTKVGFDFIATPLYLLETNNY